METLIADLLNLKTAIVPLVGVVGAAIGATILSK